jgi:hypothetical protein
VLRAGIADSCMSKAESPVARSICYPQVADSSWGPSWRTMGTLLARLRVIHRTVLAQANILNQIGFE